MKALNLLSYVLVIYTCALSFLNAKDKEREFGKYKVKLEGKSGKIRIEYFNKSKLTVDFSSMYEVTPEGKEIKGKYHQFDNFKNLDFDVSDFVESTYQNLNCSIVTMKVNDFIKEGSYITGQIIIFNQTGLVDTGNSTMEKVRPGTMKLNLKIDKWPFCNNTGASTDEKECSNKDGTPIQNQYLDVDIEIKGKMDGKKLNKKNNITLGDSYASFSPYYMADNELKTMPDDYPNLKVKGDKNIIKLRFNRFDNVLEWDPIFQMNESDEPILPENEPMNPTVYIIIAAIIVVSVVTLTSFFICRRNAKKKETEINLV
jgi:hypothetical protein